ncbi:cryptochrome/photolyase family protein [Phaeobacter sp. QD34_3]|uniref:cryptochrome/photolyase family protein n=1 Tax=unclassified Phaeobacter TaxID=2621772 RepID=UPI00237F7D74|nr:MULTISPECIES: cryptochrome/photolyase family protein [unclassified Phaeobacter]MDE4134101.1 cryptochrome/photolyase family protein [Phaeobacter sp. QD34_3]MDE4137843.1 cryptochrome/photolyase family protein [Phaeobacter sp. QD34_24]
MARLILILGDQLSETLSALQAGDKARDTVVMAEVTEEGAYVRHHPKKIALILAAMRKFASHLQDQGWGVAYTRLDDAKNTGTIAGELLRRAAQTGADEVIATTPGEWRLIRELQSLPLKVSLRPDTRFIATRADFADWAEGRKQLRMEYFYREMRRKTGLLMEGGKPVGGKWNFDQENRKAPPKEITCADPMQFTPDAETEAVLDLVARRFGDHFGDLRPFHFAVTRADARRALQQFIREGLPLFGNYQDAMLRGQKWLYHSVLSPYLNIGLLLPLEVCRAAEDAWKAGDVPINAAEGFIRQILGWREFVRGIYFVQGEDYPSRNALDHRRALPPLYWGAETEMRCLSEAVAQTREEAYAHHIQRLMVTGNFALLAGINPTEVHEWYLAVYADAFEWVEAPNTVGMSQFADGGIVGSKPYVSSGAYINRMSDYCKSCAYKVSQKLGEGACPFNLLYWHFLARHRERFEGNPRMGNMYRTWDRMEDGRRARIIAQAEDFLTRMEAGDRV